MECNELENYFAVSFLRNNFYRLASPKALYLLDIKTLFCFGQTTRAGGCLRQFADDFRIIMKMKKTDEHKDTDLPNFHRINKNLYRGGQPTAEGIRQLAELGIKTIVTFREMREKIQREKELAEANGIRFINLHLSNWFSSTDEQIHAIIEVITNLDNQPVFIHCKRGADRTGTIIAVYRMKFENWTDKQANREAKKYGIGWWQVWMKDYIKDYYERVIMKKD